jgi:membrane protein YqaA with SNARE-associated domain
VPSEIVIPPAAFWAAQGRMSFAGVVLAGTFGSWLGSAITYWVSRWIGRAVILRWGRLVFIKPDGLDRAERFVQRYEVGGVFFARLLPVIRHLISIPAGIARMSFGVFSLVTVLGAFFWCTVLAWFGAKITAAHPDLMNDPEALMRMVKQEGHWIVGRGPGAVRPLFPGDAADQPDTAELPDRPARSAASARNGGLAGVHRGLIPGPAYQAGGEQAVVHPAQARRQARPQQRRVLDGHQVFRDRPRSSSAVIQ